MKLDNKGFAFSTLLYGILAVIIVVLMLLFGLYSRTADELYYYAAVEEENLNRCVEQEIALENCYANCSSNCNVECNPSAYYACLGIEDKAGGTKVNAAEYLKSHPSSGFTSINNYELKYIYKGTDVHNYVSFSNDVWRIIGITNTGLIKIGYFGLIDNQKWDNAGEDDWVNSSLYNYLNNGFFNSIADNQMIYKVSFNTGKLDDTASQNAATILTKEKAEQQASMVGLLNLSDYIKASSSATCNTSIINTTNCDSWMIRAGRSSWLINATNATSPKKAYVMVYNSSNTTGKIQSANITSNYTVVPVVYLSSDVKLIQGAGDGQKSSPYILGK